MVGALAVGVAVLGYQVYQERQKPGLSISIGGNVGSGTLTFRGRTYPLTVGGMSYGFTFGGSQTNLRGTVSNISRASDIEGVYGAAGAGATIIRGPQAIVLTNQKGAVLQLSGTQTGLMVNLDVSGMALTLQR